MFNIDFPIVFISICSVKDIFCNNKVKNVVFNIAVVLMYVLWLSQKRNHMHALYLTILS